MRERRYWQVAAIVVLVAGVVLGWRYPGCLPTNPGLHVVDHCNSPIGFSVGIASVGLALILALVGRLRDPN